MKSGANFFCNVLMVGQVVTNEELRNLLALGGEEMMAINLPDLIGGKSEILEEEDMRNITRHLTARAEG